LNHAVVLAEAVKQVVPHVDMQVYGRNKSLRIANAPKYSFETHRIVKDCNIYKSKH
jgi:hypothetical protein